MGMVLVLRRVDATQIAYLRANPDEAAEFAVEDEAAVESGDCVDFDKAWHVLHFMFTGSAAENNQALSLLRTDFEAIGEDIGYGPVQYHTPETAARIHNALSAISDAELWQRYDPAAIAAADLYMGETLSEADEFTEQYLMQGIPALRAVVARCAATNSGLLTVIT
jgi:hypothetical protein